MDRISYRASTGEIYPDNPRMAPHSFFNLLVRKYPRRTERETGDLLLTRSVNTRNTKLFSN